MKILGLSGKKQSGKNTSVNYLFGLEIFSGTWNYKGEVFQLEKFKVNEKGKLVVPIENNRVVADTVLDIENPNDSLRYFLETNIWPFLKCYSFADKLKQMAIHIFGLTYNQCYGTDDYKNTYTIYEWKNMPKNLLKAFWKKEEVPDRHITARELLQLLGTEVFRAIHNDIWVDACIRQIGTEQPELAIISDVRFPNEVKGIQAAGGKVIRLTRCVNQDSHGSETALDDFDGWDYVLDNREMTITEQNEIFINKLKEWNYLPFPANGKK